LSETDDRLGEMSATLATHSQMLDALPAMGAALEGLAARIDALDGVTGQLSARLGPPRNGRVSPEVQPVTAPTEAPPVAPRRRRPQPSVTFPKINGRLRILGVNELFPLISETYIREEVISLVPFGADVAWFRHAPGPAQQPVPEPVFDDFEAAIAAIEPDVAIVHWLTTAKHSLPLFEQHELPFAVRAHSFDFDQALLRELIEHPLCAGAWTFPSPDYSFDGAHSLSPTISSTDLLQPPVAVRDAVVSISAGLPKKDWPLLLDAFDLMDQGDRRLIIGITNEHEDVSGELARACETLANPPLLQVNVLRRDVFALLTRTAIFVYTLRPEARFGMPMSIVDALCAGCAVVVPDRPEAIAFAGPDARSYKSADDIARHVEEVLTGGPAIATEWERNRERGRTLFCDTGAHRVFNQELRAGIARVRTAQGSPVRV